MSRLEDRQRLQAKAAYRLRQQGYTNNQIAEQVGLDEKVVPARVKLGERLIDAEK